MIDHFKGPGIISLETEDIDGEWISGDPTFHHAGSETMLDAKVINHVHFGGRFFAQAEDGALRAQAGYFFDVQGSPEPAVGQPPGHVGASAGYAVPHSARMDQRREAAEFRRSSLSSPLR
ncbi:hypothetical protein [Neorhizobium petrolearium]|uniref:hypothetical protein n=1 Tax=Neorhizobium petrolearium TaxID=515361 RepID=UPI003F18532F